MVAERLKEEFGTGRIDVDRLIELIESLSRQLDKANRRIAELEKKNDQLTKKLG